MTMFKDWAGTGRRYETSYQAIRDLRIPTRQKAQQIFERLFRTNPEYRQKLQDTLLEASGLGDTKQMSSEERAFARWHVLHQIEESTGIKRSDPSFDFITGIYSMVLRREDGRILAKTLKDAGFDAIEDFFDSAQFTKQPLIVLDPGETLVKTGERLVTRAVRVQTLDELISRGIRRFGFKGSYKDSLGALDSTIVARIAAKVGLFDLPNE